ncbi:MAG TPA: hypothetical protein VKZ61_05425 [Thermomicrobiales bacterium]|nr:hypothetical protein [Thermomicrobiales bacterium]
MSENRASNSGPGHSRRAWALWTFILAGLCLWVAARMGLFDLTRSNDVEGGTVSVPNMYGTVDHPFHAARGAILLDSLRDGELLRWVGQHQGGYPVEFYPLGIAWLDVAIHALTFGTISILSAHKVAVIIVFLLPAVSFWLLARGDRMHPATAVLATAVHVAVPGHWLNGGYEELVGWGLVTNVAGASLAFLATVSLARFVLNREFGMGILATLVAAGGAVTNPRSLFAIVIAALALFVVAVLRQDGRALRIRAADALLRIAGVGGIAFLLAAPVVLALFRYNSEYFFLHYEFYDPLSEYWTAMTTAVSAPVAVLAVIGLILALLPLRAASNVSRGVAAAGLGYGLLTIWVATASVVPPLVEQLEAPRLMPYQRQLMIWLAVYAVAWAAGSVTRKIEGWQGEWMPAFVLAGLAIVVLVAHVRPFGFIPDEHVGLREISTTGNADHANFVLAIERGEEVRPAGTAMFVIGNRDDWWHQQLWGPAYSDARFNYDDWMWYWHDDHAGPYQPANGYWMPNPTDALEGSYLDDNGIGVVAVSDMWVPSGAPPRESARNNPRLTFVETFGAWDVYTVNQPTAIVTNGDTLPAEISVGNHEIRARFDDGDGNILVRQNWFDRWTATVNGAPAEIVRRPDGYMEIVAPPGAVDVRLEYSLTGLDWVGRSASVAGVLLLGVAAWRGPTLFRRLHDETAISDTLTMSSTQEGTP